MSTFVRWCKFNLVGAVGMLFQLCALSALNRVAHGHYLVATAAAIELTLLHNFIWHLHYTWPDRRHNDGVWRKIARFHLSNGLVSMTGNLVAMGLLVGAAHLPVLAANGIAILACSMVNFWLSHTWAFAGSSIQAAHANAETWTSGLSQRIRYQNLSAWQPGLPRVLRLKWLRKNSGF